MERVWRRPERAAVFGARLGHATPIVYEQNGKEYLVIMAGGHHFMLTPPGDALIAYALPDTK